MLPSVARVVNTTGGRRRRRRTKQRYGTVTLCVNLLQCSCTARLFIPDSENSSGNDTKVDKQPYYPPGVCTTYAV